MGAKATDRFPCHRIRVIVNATCDTINGSSIPRRCVVEPSDLRSVQSKDFKDGLEIGRAPAFTKEEHLRPCQRHGNWMVGAGLSGQVHCIAPDASALTRATQRYQCGAGTGSATTALGRSTAIPIAVTQ